ncbi:hydroxybutyrate-dimer hydrolase [Chitinivorax tropicus]|uniref:Hydroxybutyrate-dimer hydrolase n=1 Tax=Chitinivorax tropicus TaxID=714531 RepID=A0A840MEB8_9PROT|nr:3-hydroxybutyrate oligomer hydrolase family protein [Chitinivorax tropicus]MBB5017028.1 hydroxybutyrate-dimer hydrolase [Chitinivorax tropicus]
MVSVRLWWVGVLLGLAGCGGGGGSGAGDNAVLHGELQGTAATGDAIAQAALVLKDAKGQERHAVTDDQGQYRISVEGLTAPLMLEVVTGAGERLHSLALADEAGGPININQVTELIARRALGAEPGAVFQQAGHRSLVADTLRSAEQGVMRALREAGALPDQFETSFRQAVMQIGDELDRSLDTLGDLKEAEVSGGILNFKLLNIRPAFLQGEIKQARYDGQADDLLTAGLGKTGLAAPSAPLFADPAQPTAAELRRNAIWSNYRAVLDISTAGGYGRLWGPNIDTQGANTLGEGKIAGTEYLAFAGDRSGKENVVLMVQVPDSFKLDKPCIVTAASSGSRGIYGAIGSAGEWGLKHGCAVAYTDKGSGASVHDLVSDTVMLLDGTRQVAEPAGKLAHFRARLSDQVLQQYNAGFPNRVAVKHAHSQQNPEKDWGRNTLDSVRFAYYVLNQQFGSDAGKGRRYRDAVKPARTIVIASSISNGGGAALAAAEQDSAGLISGVAVSEPNVEVSGIEGVTIRQGDVVFEQVGKPLLDYISYANLYQPCAALSPALAGAPSNVVDPVRGAVRCARLASLGLLAGDTTLSQANAALAKLRAYGWNADSDIAQPFQYVFAATQGIAMAYANAYGRFSVADNLCQFGYAVTNNLGLVIPTTPLGLAPLYATLNGIPPSSGISMVYGSTGLTTIREDLATNAQGQRDYNLDGALCLRRLVTGIDPVTQQALTGNEQAQSSRIQSGLKQVLRSANLRGKPALIVTGRADALLAINHTSRAYVLANHLKEGGNSRLRYIEITHGQHFDAFLGLAGFGTRFTPVHYYFDQAMDHMYVHLSQGRGLPPSQVVRATPRANQADELTIANLPAISTSPVAADQIQVVNKQLVVPQ